MLLDVHAQKKLISFGGNGNHPRRMKELLGVQKAYHNPRMLQVRAT